MDSKARLILSIIKHQIKQDILEKSLIIIGLKNNHEQNLKILRCAKEIWLKYNIKILFIGGRSSFNNSKLMSYFHCPLFEVVDLPDIKNINDKKEKFIKIAKKIKQIIRYVDTLSNEFKAIPVKCDFPEILLIGLVFFTEILTLLNIDMMPNEFQNINPNLISGIRGGLPSSKFLQTLKEFVNFINKKYGEINFFSRIAILETADKHQFFYAPVGIDEANTFQKKKRLILNTYFLLRSLAIKPNMYILSGGRRGDRGRDPVVDKTLDEAERLIRETTQEIISKYKQKQDDFQIVNGEILIENAAKRKANLILAPDGISGNLIYRTLVHLGNGKAYGALYSNIYFKYKKILIDCSRIAEESEILGSFIFAIGFLGHSTKFNKN
ncbi:MAG: hypothetical protein ACTSRZ_01465 [Promethearchaeota archaeon]